MQFDSLYKYSYIDDVISKYLVCEPSSCYDMLVGHRGIRSQAPTDDLGIVTEHI